MESSRANQVGTKRFALAKTKLRHVDNVWNNLRLESEFAKHIDEMSRRNHQPIRIFQHRPHTAEPAEMIARLAAVIVDHRRCSTEPADKPRRQWCDQKRPVRSGKDMRNLDAPQTPPERNQIDGFAD